MAGRQVVAFRLGEEEYAVGIQAVKEIIRPSAITRVPRTPEYIKGVINLRGVVVPVISLNERFGREGTELKEESRIIILSLEDMTAGIIVDSVSEVVWLGEEDIQEPDLTQIIDEKYIDGVGKLDNRLLILLNLKEILSIKDRSEDFRGLKVMH